MYKLLKNSTSVLRTVDGAVIPSDSRNTDWQQYQAWLSGGNIAQPVDETAQEQIIADVTSGIQKRLDEFARTRNYDGILSACTYAASTVVKFQAEGQYCVQVRDATWAAAYQILEQALAGNWPIAGGGQIPTSIADIEADLPSLTWPN